jgi:hypothetical protein
MIRYVPIEGLDMHQEPMTEHERDMLVVDAVKSSGIGIRTALSRFREISVCDGCRKETCTCEVTAGEWRFGAGKSGVWYALGERGIQYTRASYADVRLMMAAKDMLAALEMCAGYFQRMSTTPLRVALKSTGNGADTTRAVREAIQKPKMPCQPTS